MWKNDKLISAVRMLSESKKPAVYSSTFDIVDEELNMVRENAGITWPYELRETLVYRGPLGCTVVMNSALKELIVKRIPSYIRMHDHWTTLIAELVDADIFIDKSSHILYRQHGDNVVGGQTKGIGRIKRLFASYKQKPNERLVQAKCLLETCQDLMSPNDRQTVTEFTEYKKG